jgi:predicted dehydrogenase
MPASMHDADQWRIKFPGAARNIPAVPRAGRAVSVEGRVRPVAGLMVRSRAAVERTWRFERPQCGGAGAEPLLTSISHCRQAPGSVPETTGALRMTTSTPRRLQIGVLGAASIARQFIAGVRPSTKVAVTAVASRDVERARRFARETGIARVHSTYEALLADPAIDAIYNPLPNSLHAEWSIRAAEAGKHVLCEKPLATSAREARAMFEAARRNGVQLAEAYPYRAQPQTLKMRELLAAGAIGRLQFVQAAFGFPLADPSNIRMNPALAGGALMDAGCYPVSLVRTIAGERPLRVQAMAGWAESGVDRTLVASMEFASGLLAQISCSFATARHRHAFIAGDAGSIVTTYFNETSAALPPVIEVKRGSGWDAERESVTCAASNGFLAEADAFHDLVVHGRESWIGASIEESIDIAMTLEALAASAHDGDSVEIGA